MKLTSFLTHQHIVQYFYFICHSSENLSWQARDGFVFTQEFETWPLRSPNLVAFVCSVGKLSMTIKEPKTKSHITIHKRWRRPIHVCLRHCGEILKFEQIHPRPMREHLILQRSSSNWNATTGCQKRENKLLTRRTWPRRIPRQQKTTKRKKKNLKSIGVSDRMRGQGR